MPLSQTITQQQVQQQTLTPQQLLAAQLTELPADGLRERIDKELEENQWLERVGGRIPSQARTAAPAREDADFAESLYDHLAGQLGEYDLDDRQRYVAEYLIGSLHDDGLMRTPLREIADELDIYHNVQCGEGELADLLTRVVQQMSPAGVGARDLQECLLIQARQLPAAEREPLATLLTRHWQDFARNRWERIQAALALDDDQTEQLRQRVRSLTPRPGSSVGNSLDGGSRTATPDFTVTLAPDGRLTLSLCQTDLPQLQVSPDAESQLAVPLVTAADRQAARYLRGRVESARMFLAAMEQRRRSMTLVMKAIIKLQHRYFLSGDTMDLAPMKLDDVARLTGLDASTVSRVCSSKYAHTPYGTVPLRWFFTTSASKDGAEVSVRNIRLALKALIEAETAPLSDERLTELLKEQGYQVARRTVAKYRTQMGIAESRFRGLGN